jgi:uncharacterized protein YjbJ (UPF0337 family)
MIMSDNGFIDKITGGVKQNVSKVIGKTKTQSKGIADKAVGSVKEAIHDLFNAIDGAIDRIRKNFRTNLKK